ncbi:MAG: hypothetical protein IPL53_06725 [Ignavibacteria bacterium]|nr:hypothetical protein [Ignavibacteria bacterium]
MENLMLEKSIWTEQDFWDMRWHDACLHGWAIENKGDQESDLLLDIDYIFAWIPPVPPSTHFAYWIAPCTVVFTNVSSFHIYCDEDGYLDVMSISDIYMQQKPMKEMGISDYEWKIDLFNGK